MQRKSWSLRDRFLIQAKEISLKETLVPKELEEIRSACKASLESGKQEAPFTRILLVAQEGYITSDDISQELRMPD